METPRNNIELMADLRRDEGLRLTAYPDPLTHGAPWTIGYGHTGPDVRPNMEITPAIAETWLRQDTEHAVAGAMTLEGWDSWSSVQQDAVANMVFNMGLAKVKTFTTFLQYMAAMHFGMAALDLAGTAWYKQVGARAKRIQTMIRTGARP